MADHSFGVPTDTHTPASPTLATAEEILSELRRSTRESPRGHRAAFALDEVAAQGPRQPPSPTLTHHAIEPLIVPLEELAWRSRAAAWGDLVLDLIQRVPVAQRKPAQVLRLALAAPTAARPMLLAEYWRLLVAGCRHDAGYVVPIALDVWGDVLSNPPQLLARTLATVGSPESGGPGQTSPTPTTRRARLESALDALDTLAPRFDFVRGWGLVRLRPLLEAAGLGTEALRRVRSLSDRLGARRDTLRRWHEPGAGAVCCELPRRHDVKPLSVTCGRGLRQRRILVYVGRPAPPYHPLHFQAARAYDAYGVILDRRTLDRILETQIPSRERGDLPAAADRVFVT